MSGCSYHCNILLTIQLYSIFNPLQRLGNMFKLLLILLGLLQTIQETREESDVELTCSQITDGEKALNNTKHFNLIIVDS